ncbi:hypothetical protein [Micromonospora cremea]|uniref:hypothetical protein n=1 Tax=Micromonospora cremea TaxID=709881 RepID=UPI00117E194A|nr:hypothetical protein [Micromonospora cremea]
MTDALAGGPAVPGLLRRVRLPAEGAPDPTVGFRLGETGRDEQVAGRGAYLGEDDGSGETDLTLVRRAGMVNGLQGFLPRIVRLLSSSELVPEYPHRLSKAENRVDHRCRDWFLVLDDSDSSTDQGPAAAHRPLQWLGGSGVVTEHAVPVPP